FGDHFPLGMTDDLVLEVESIRLEGEQAGADGNAVRICERSTKARLGRCQDGADAGCLFKRKPVEAAKVLQTRVFEITEIDDVVDVLVGVHLAPNYGLCD